MADLQLLGQELSIMNPQIRSFTALALCALTLSSGCKPVQPFFFAEDGNILGRGDLSHYMDVATDIEYPDVTEPSLDEVYAARAPLTVANAEDFEMWDLTLEEVSRYTLANSQVIRQLGGRISDGGSNIAGAVPSVLQQNPGGVVTTYDPALVESGNGTGSGSALSGTGVESALAEFDAQLDASITWQNNDRPQNFGLQGAFNNFFASQFRQDTSNATIGITKTSADGTRFEIRSNTLYDYNNNGSRIQPSDWFTNVEAAVTHPLLQGRGTQYNRIAGPVSLQQVAGGAVNQIDGVIISRIRQDITLTDFEAAVRDLMHDVEDAYWELYFAYHDLEARKIGRDSALETWRKVKTLQRVGGQGGEADKEAQARSQYYQFRSQVESALTNLFRIENRLRYMMGLAATDGRLIRPVDEPTMAEVRFDWPTIHAEALARRSELRKQKWQVKRRELELIASRNDLLPRLDAVGRYRWLGAGDDLLASNPSGLTPFNRGSNAFESLTTGNYQEWELGLQFSMPIGFRRAMTGVRHYQLLLARERAVLQDMELEISHQLGDTIRDVDLNFRKTQTSFNRRVAAQDEVDAFATIYESGRVTLDLLLQAQNRRADAETEYFRSLIDYNRAIMNVHYRKGSLLEYNGVYLAEGPWPGKAYFDASRRARQRDASTNLNYGFSRPSVISRGPMDQSMGRADEAEELPTPLTEEPFAEEPFLEGPTFEELLPQQPSVPVDKVILTPAAFEITGGELKQAAVAIDLSGAASENNEPRELRPIEVDIVPTMLPLPQTAEPANTLRTDLQTSTAPVHDNPYRQEMSDWMNSTTRGLPAVSHSSNPLRSFAPHQQIAPSWARDRQPTDESHSYHTSVEATPDAPVGQRTKR